MSREERNGRKNSQQGGGGGWGVRGAGDAVLSRRRRRRRSEQLRYMCNVLLRCSTWAGCLCSGVEQILAGGRDDELGSVRMTNAGAALPRLDCPSESHRREGADQNRKFRVRDGRGHRARWRGRRGGRRDHLGSMASN